MEIVQRMSDAEWAKLKEVSRMLTELTVHHAHYCKCELCDARASCCVDGADLRTVRFTPAPNPNN